MSCHYYCFFGYYHFFYNTFAFSISSFYILILVTFFSGYCYFPLSTPGFCTLTLIITFSANPFSSILTFVFVYLSLFTPGFIAFSLIISNSTSISICYSFFTFFKDLTTSSFPRRVVKSTLLLLKDNYIDIYTVNSLKISKKRLQLNIDKYNKKKP